LLPFFDGDDNVVGVSGPDEGFGIIVCLGDEAVDGGLQVGNGSEYAALAATPGKLGEEDLDGVEPGTGGLGEVESPPRMAVQPGPDLGMLMDGVFIDDGVDNLAGWDGGLAGVEEADEFLVVMALHVATDDRAVEEVECNEQRCRAVKLIVMGHRPASARPHWQARLGTNEGLDLALFIDAEDHGVGRRTIEAWRCHFNTEPPQSALDYRGLAIVAGLPTPVDLLDNASALATTR